MRQAAGSAFLRPPRPPRPPVMVEASFAPTEGPWGAYHCRNLGKSFDMLRMALGRGRAGHGEHLVLVHQHHDDPQAGACGPRSVMFLAGFDPVTSSFMNRWPSV